VCGCLEGLYLIKIDVHALQLEVRCAIVSSRCQRAIL
jgi:hypothetical protein